MDPLLAALQPDQQHPFLKLVIRANNTRVHISRMVDEYFESHRLRRADHPPYSSDLAPSGFFLSGVIKGKLKGAHIPNGQTLICELRQKLSELPLGILPSTFDAWSDARPLAETTSRTEHKAWPDSLWSFSHRPMLSVTLETLYISGQ
jgi:hypothetical protein